MNLTIPTQKDHKNKSVILISISSLESSLKNLRMTCLNIFINQIRILKQFRCPKYYSEIETI